MQMQKLNWGISLTHCGVFICARLLFHLQGVWFMEREETIITLAGSQALPLVH